MRRARMGASMGEQWARMGAARAPHAPPSWISRPRLHPPGSICCAAAWRGTGRARRARRAATPARAAAQLLPRRPPAAQLAAAASAAVRRAGGWRCRLRWRWAPWRGRRPAFRADRASTVVARSGGGFRKRAFGRFKGCNLTEQFSDSGMRAVEKVGGRTSRAAASVLRVLPGWLCSVLHDWRLLQPGPPFRPLACNR